MKAAVKKTNNKSFMEYAIWVDFPLNAAICAYLIVKIVQAVQMGIGKVIESGFVFIDGGEVDVALGSLLVVIGIYSVISVVIEFIYLMLKLNQKEPYITEKYAVLSVVFKVIAVVALAAIIVIFS